MITLTSTAVFPPTFCRESPQYHRACLRQPCPSCCFSWWNAKNEETKSTSKSYIQMKSDVNFPDATSSHLSPLAGGTGEEQIEMQQF